MLLHELKHPGDTEQKLIEQCRRTGRPLPEHIANPPQLLPGLGLYLAAYSDLSSCRIVGMSEGPIPWTAVRQYAQLSDFDEEQTRLLHKYVKAMDAAYLEFRGSK